MAALDSPLYTRAHVDNCAFASWYPSFQQVSIKSVVVQLPPAFVALLLADGVKVPGTDKKIEELHAENDAAPLDDDAVAVENTREEIKQAIKKLGGCVFPKLNWSAPRDASWMLGSLKCTSFEDVFLLLKSSDFMVHDLTQPYGGCTDLTEAEAADVVPETVTLVLKKWCNFYDSMHFRCFVVNHTLVGVSQRHCDEFYDFLVDQQDHLCEVIYRFFHTNFRQGQKNSSLFPDAEYVLDVYVDKQHRVHLVDINVFGDVTDPLLFTWEELIEWRDAGRQRRATQAEDDSEDEDEQVVEFRIVETAKGIRANPMSSYRTPTDFVDHLAANGGFDAFMEQVRRDNANADDSSDEDDNEEEEDDEDVAWGSDDDNYD
ncbi:hypothetical protein Poli38472_009659 [Pythium oligandrum]|uniref:Cell division cycle protein 123 n=1 Tax=Pythium oligandrum TaxID=41045 RepID=A0A8K1CEW9_PYTOL|nr:hypothetical protein Poli38472_009659 [Pythium oligandrum]|eukprot:TMW62166.1 hypothetical protein Poli38472_009659 [Pythium oligandrum]